MLKPGDIFGRMLADFRLGWSQLLKTHIVCSFAAYVVLIPLISLAAGYAISLSGRAAISDMDILFFLLQPGGFITLLIAFALIITVVILKFSALLTISYSLVHRKKINHIQALMFTFRHSGAVFHIVLSVLTKCLVYCIPLIFVIALTYQLLLTQYDINYYLTEKPSEFRNALWISGSCAAVMLIILLKVFNNAIFALQLLLFKRIPYQKVLGESRRLVRGKKKLVIYSLLSWITGSAFLLIFATGMISAVGAYLLPKTVDNLFALTLFSGFMAFFYWATTFFIGFFNISMLSLLFAHLYHLTGTDDDYAFHKGDDDVVQTFSHPYKISRRITVWSCLLLAIISGLIGYSFVRQMGREEAVQVIAHRGASATAPENTMAAVKQAIKDGADWVEIDVQETADGKVVVIHDRDLKKIGHSDLTIHGNSLATLRTVDIGSWFDPKFADQRLSTLRQVLETCKGKCGVYIELKYYGYQQDLEKHVIDIVESTGMTDHVKIISLDYDGLAKIKALRPTWETGLLTSVVLGNDEKMNVDFFALNAKFATHSFIKKVQHHHKQVVTWTINDAYGMSSMISYGANGIITDKPALAVSVLKQRADLSPPERLLINLAGLFGVRTDYLEQ